MRFKVGDEVIVRIIREHHLLEKSEAPATAKGKVTYVHQDQRYIVVEMELGLATIREAFKPDDVRAVIRHEEE